MEGTHWETDNTSLWQILSNLVRDGPGWDYIQVFEKRGNGDGRSAFLELKAQAYQFSNVRLMTDEAHANLRTLKYAGPSKNWNYDKYVRSWLRNVRVLKEWDDCPSNRRLVSDFCSGISDPRLESAINQVLQEDSKYVEDLDKTQKFFTTVIGTSISRQKMQKSRNVSAVSFQGNNQQKGDTRSKPKFTGKLEANKSYTDKEWHSMSKKQKDEVRKLRDAVKPSTKADSNNKRNASAVSSDSGTQDNAGDQFGRKAHQNKKSKGQNAGDEQE
jgi:hypothetical protein